MKSNCCHNDVATQGFAQRVLVSKCLRGHDCAYDRKIAERQLDDDLIRRLGIVPEPVCPEQLGQLPTPRERMEIVGGDGNDVRLGRAVVRTSDGRDLTNAMIDGARETVVLARSNGITKMIARRRSPSCSCGQIYDGTFSNTLRSGVGVTTAFLRAEGIEVVELEALITNLFCRTLCQILHVYRSADSWDERLAKASQLLRDDFPISNAIPWLNELRGAFRRAMPSLQLQDGTTTDLSDSDTNRFFQDVFRMTWNQDLLDVQ